MILTWMKEIDTCEREIFFFHKSGDMFQLIQPQRQSSSLSLANNPKFECKCDLEIGEHEGSLNIGDSGVYEISPFSIKNQPKPVTVVLKTLIHKAKSDQGILKLFSYLENFEIQFLFFSERTKIRSIVSIYDKQTDNE